MTDAWKDFIAQGGGWWCPNCQKRVEVTQTETQREDKIFGEVVCSNCLLTLDQYCVPIPKIGGGE